MKITEIIVNAGRVFNHPFEQFSNLRPSVTLKAVLEDGEDAIQSVKNLQAQAEQLVEDHKNSLVATLNQLRLMKIRDQEIAQLETLIKRSQERLEQVREGTVMDEQTQQLSMGAIPDTDNLV